MEATFKDVVTTVLPNHCYDEFFIKFNYYHANCIKVTISKLLGIGIIAGSILVKVPQIVKLVAGKSAEGINIWGIFLELLAITATIAYSLENSFPFSSWGEGLFLLIQTLIIAILVLYYEYKMTTVWLFVSVYFSFLYWMVAGFAPSVVLSILQGTNVPIVVTSKALQAFQNYQNGSTGQLSAITIFLLFGGSMARIFTSVQETGDSLIIVTFISSTLANGLLAAQMLYYWNKTAPLAHLKLN